MPHPIRTLLPAGLLVFLSTLPACTPADEPVADTTTAPRAEADRHRADSLAVAGVVDLFETALAAGDSVAVAGLLAADALILESGGQETKEEYLSHHFHSDAAFLGATAREPATRRFYLAGDAAWVASTSRIHGVFRDRDVDVNSAELLVLRRNPEGWRVAVIHWSSRSRSR